MCPVVNKQPLTTFPHSNARPGTLLELFTLCIAYNDNTPL